MHGARDRAGGVGGGLDRGSATLILGPAGSGKRAAARYFWRWELPRTGAQFDLLESLDRTVLDTPPSRHAIEFLDSPQRLCRFVDNRLYRTVLAPRSGVLRSASSR